jgi:hypothetical protein
VPGLALVSIVVEMLGGSSVQAGVVSIMFTLSATLLSIIFGPLYKAFKKFMSPLCFLAITIGLAILYFANSIFMAGLGMFFIGVLLVTIPSFLLDNSIYTTADSVTFATAVIMVFLNIGIFLAGPVIKIADMLTTDIILPGIFFGLIGMAALTIVTFIARIKQKDAGMN